MVAADPSAPNIPVLPSKVRKSRASVARLALRRESVGMLAYACRVSPAGITVATAAPVVVVPLVEVVVVVVLAKLVVVDRKLVVVVDTLAKLEVVERTLLVVVLAKLLVEMGPMLALVVVLLAKALVVLIMDVLELVEVVGGAG